MRLARILTAAMLTAAVVVFSLPAAVFAAESELKSGTFRFLPSDGGAVLTREFYCSDSYFSSSGKETNEHLRTMSLDLALTAFGSYEIGDSAAYTKALLDDTGFSDISVEQMNEAASADSIGSVTAHKRTAYGDVIAVAVRGGYYGKEWENTLDIGHSGDLKGISESAEKIVGRIESYMTKYSIVSPKIWLTGYSRGGAVCDLAGKYLNENASRYGISADDIFVYTFEAPAASATEPCYENIHNVYADGDIVTMLFPSEWGLCHAGVPEPLGGNNVYIYRKHFEGTSIVDDYNILYSDDTGYLMTAKAAPITVSAFEREFIGWFTANADRQLCASYSPYISRFVSLFASRTSGDEARVARYMTDVAKDLSGNSLFSLRLLELIGSDGKAYDSSVAYLSSEIIKAMDRNDHKAVMSDPEYAMLRSDLPYLLRFAIPLIKADMTVTDPLSHICTFVGNTADIFSHHRQEYVLPLTESYDTYHCPLPIDGAKISVDETTAKVLSVTLDGETLKEGVDYTVSYKDSAGVFVVPEVSGRYTAVITGIAEYSGTAEKAFTAVFPHYHKWALSSFGDIASVKCTAAGCDEYHTGKAYTVRISVSDKVCDGKEASAECVTARGFPSEITVGKTIVYDEKGREVKPIEPGKYTAEVVISDPESGAGAKARITFRISPTDIGKEVTETVFKDNSPEILSFTCGGKVLTEGVDFTVYYRTEDGRSSEKPEKAGKYIALISGKGRYSGSVREEFELVPVINIPLAAALSAAVLITAAIVTVSLIKHNKKDLP